LLGGSFKRERRRGFGVGVSESERVESKFLRVNDEVSGAGHRMATVETEVRG